MKEVSNYRHVTCLLFLKRFGERKTVTGKVKLAAEGKQRVLFVDQIIFSEMQIKTEVIAVSWIIYNKGYTNELSYCVLEGLRTNKTYEKIISF